MLVELKRTVFPAVPLLESTISQFGSVVRSTVKNGGGVTEPAPMFTST
jgi:hypothetical protein